ncbi:MAG TPA: bifunctional folylpolyglutamate synthase/dihydrofolate synthase, partial [Trueperaceae bacterium]|nr:bifunctional folylpolyglutamate synthase/dihydrofolate synthase [Trueperaceae bacterium]
MKEILDWLYSQRRFSKKVGLERTQKLLKEMGNPETSFKSIIVGGTNGKGSTSSNLASILKQSGFKVGFFSSPHLSYFSERYLVNGQRLGNIEIKEALLYIKPLALKTDATFFEISFALACYLFAKNKVDYAIMEVGVGGTNDATNVLEPIQSIITNIALEHTNVLGKTHKEIAIKKSGIMRKNITTFTAATNEGLAELKNQAKLKQAKLVSLQDFKIVKIKSDWHSSKFRLSGANLDLELETPLLGNYQIKNASLAALAAKELLLADDDIKKGI